MRRLIAVCVILALAACSSNASSQPQTTSPATATTKIDKTTTKQQQATTTTSTVLGAAPSQDSTPSTTTPELTCVTQDPAKYNPPIPKLAQPTTSNHSKYKFTVDYPSSWFDGTDMSTVTASGLVDELTLKAVGVKATDTLQNMSVQAKANYPLLTVYRFDHVKATADTIAMRMVEFQKAQGLQNSPIQSWCLDGTPAQGFLSLASNGSLQQSWFAVHHGALYYAFFVGKTDGTQKTQDDLIVTFASIFVTWHWT